MSTVTATVRNRRIEFEAPDDLPDGTEVLVEVRPISERRTGITEAEWRDDPEAIADWIAWVNSIEPLEISPEEQAEFDRYNAEFVRFNLEAVRKQMEADPFS